MKKIEGWKAWTFIGGLGVIAILVHTWWDFGQGRRTPPEHKKTPKELAAEHAEYLARYLNFSIAPTASTETVAIVVASENGKPNSLLANAIANRLKTGAVKTLSSLFTPEFISDGLFSKTFDGSPSVLQALELTNSLRVVFLGRQTVEYSTNRALDNVISAHMHLGLVSVPLTRSSEIEQYEFSANGVGFKDKEARTLAEQRLLDQIAANTNICIRPKPNDR